MEKLCECRKVFNAFCSAERLCFSTLDAGMSEIHGQFSKNDRLRQMVCSRQKTKLLFIYYNFLFSQKTTIVYPSHLSVVLLIMIQ